MMEKLTYQKNYTQMGRPHEAMYDNEGRSRKAAKILAVLEDYLGDMSHLSVLDIGCSTGIITNILHDKVSKTVGIDIDVEAVKYANKSYAKKGLKFLVQDALNTGFQDESFDIVICNQIYEHVPDAKQLFHEIFRLLKPGGVCYLSATNRFKFMENHYYLPLLSVIPKSWAHIYIKIFNRGSHYYETHFSLWGLRKLTSTFKIADYTSRVLENPEKFHALDIVNPGSFRQKSALFIANRFLWLCPGYIWLLFKPTFQGKDKTS